MFKAGSLNGDARLLTATVPAIIRQPELTFDAEKWRHPKGYGMSSHRRPLALLLSGAIINQVVGPSTNFRGRHYPQSPHKSLPRSYAGEGKIGSGRGRRRAKVRSIGAHCGARNDHQQSYSIHRIWHASSDFSWRRGNSSNGFVRGDAVTCRIKAVP